MQIASTTGVNPLKIPPPQRDRFGILIVDDESEVREVLGDALRGGSLIVHEADSIEQANTITASERIDLALIDLALPDGDGLSLAREWAEERSHIQSIVITGKPSLHRAVEAIRAGAADFLAKPLDLEDLNRSVERAMQRRRDGIDREQRVGRLRPLCKQLNQARHEITQQVDILCNDLVTAYQELADQMRVVELNGEMRAVIGRELDLEHVLRHVLEFLLQKAGPTNAVIFMPASDDEYAPGGYVNYDVDRESVDLILDHLATVIAPRVAELDGAVHLVGGDDIQHTFGESHACFEDAQVVAVPCVQDDECLATIVLFRSVDEPFDENVAEMLQAIANTFAQQLVRVINIHHRHLPFEDDDEDQLML